MIAATVTNGSSRMRPKSSWPAWPPSRARSGVISPNSPMSAPTAKTNGLPVRSNPRQSRERSWSSTPSSERSAASPNVFGFCQSSPLSIVTSAIGPTRVVDALELELGRVASHRSGGSPRGPPRPCRARCRARSGRSATPGRSRKPRASCAMSRTPVAASGWPHAIAPPYGFRRGSSGATPTPSHHVSTWTAKGSFSSKRSTSSIVEPGALEHLLGRRHRSEAHQLAARHRRRRSRRGASSARGRAPPRPPRRR